MSVTVASLEIDLFSDGALLDPWPLYRRIRDAGPVVFLSRLGVWAMGRYGPVRAALRDWETYSSAQGIALNPVANGTTEGRLLTSDPPEHDTLRSVLAHRLLPRQLRDVGQTVARRAEELVEGVVAAGEFDAVSDLAQALPLGIVLDLIGLPQDGRDEILRWADGAFSASGPEGPRTARGLALLEEQFQYLITRATRDQLAPGSMGWAIYQAADEGRIDAKSTLPLMSAYLTAGLDTTVNAIGNAVYYFAHNPGQWDLVRQNPEIVANAFNEVLRVESPVQFFTRVTTREVDVEGVRLPEGARVMMMYASANRDERRWENPATFDVRRNAAEHIAFGHGVHGCAGQALARIEGHAILQSLAKRVARFEVSAPERRINQLIRGFKSLPTVVQAG
ncbi:cytochrome P450 [Amycolatopsis pithecellobii]|uniref:Cytochrome P450 n=1 Tax=Amycolatopsis pithecellobii TaxID=664692 RepID=A0A6N7Z2I2_9PSEU|nr:cytochrome P450 [Amycolatopsis pithecellobii]MTD54024.1 cytochrome P450 [Amycolatopsis pithecellobii]